MKTLSFFTVSVLAAAVFFGTRSATTVVGGPQAAPPEKASAENIFKRFVDECVTIQPGTESFPKGFQMGGPIEGPLSAPVHEVTMVATFRISRFEVTQELYRAVMGVNPSRWKGERNSVEMVSFLDAQQFCGLLTDLLQAKRLITPKEQVRLPTEAEWEYCCRAGTTTPFSFGDSATAEGDQGNIASILNEYGWHTGNAAGNDPVVGALKPNPWGLYDVHGYLWEYVADPYGASVAGKDELADATTQNSAVADAARIIRGGSWRDHHSLLSSHSRLTIPAHAASDAIGFRCVIEKTP